MTKVIDKSKFFERIGYKPHSHGQWKFHRSKARFKFPCCGRRYGKSTMAGRDVEPELFLPGKRFWIVGPTYDLGEKEFRVIWDDLIVKLQLGRDKRVKKAYNKLAGVMYIEFPWQTRIEVRSAEHPERLVGDALHGVIMSEAAKHKRETWERFIRPSLADYRGWATFPTTPEGHNWFYELWLHGQNENIPEYESWRFPSWENPVVYPGGREDREITLLEQTTTPEWFAQEIGADFSSFVGKIYDEFDEAIHVKTCHYNPAWPTYGCWDWGFVNPLAFVEFQVDPWDNIHIFREHYMAYELLGAHVNLIKGREDPYGYHLDLMFGDAADPEAAATVATLMGVQCIADPEAKANWRQGVDLVKTFLRPRDTGLVQDEFGTPLYKPKLFIDPSCTNAIREFGSYRAPEKVNSNLREHGASSAAQKQDDHILDAIRYGLVSIYVLGATHHLSETASYGTNPEKGYVDDAPIFSSETNSGIFTTTGMRF